MVSAFFNINYINDISFYNIFINFDEHMYANQLLSFSDDDWSKYSYMYNTENLEDYVKMGDSNGDIIVKFKLSSVNQSSFNNIIYNLQHLIHRYEVGTYEYDGFTIIINKKDNLIKEKIKITNPSIKESHKYLVS